MNWLGIAVLVVSLYLAVDEAINTKLGACAFWLFWAAVQMGCYV